MNVSCWVTETTTEVLSFVREWNSHKLILEQVLAANQTQRQLFSFQLYRYTATQRWKRIGKVSESSLLNCNWGRIRCKINKKKIESSRNLNWWIYARIVVLLTVTEEKRRQQKKSLCNECNKNTEADGMRNDAHCENKKDELSCCIKLKSEIIAR